MTNPTDSGVQLWRQPGVMYYLFVCLAALSMMYHVLDAHGLEANWALAPIMVGLVGLPLCWSKAPVLLLLVLGVCVSVEPNRNLLSVHQSGVRVSDLLLCGATLAYVVGHSRLRSLVKEIVSAPPATISWSWRGRRATPAGNSPPVGRTTGKPQRSAGLVAAREIGQLLIWLPVWAMAAQMLSSLLPRDLGNPRADLDGRIWYPMWRAVALVWMLGVFLFVVTGILEFWSRRRMAVEEGTLYLQDVLWHETRGEQRRLNRWLAWARLGRPMGVADRLVDFATTAMLLFYLAMLSWVVLELYRALAGS